VPPEDLPTDPLTRSRSLQRQSAALRIAAADLRRASARLRQRLQDIREQLARFALKGR
jgi:ABC-type transporter Mla subunit MlaD